MKTEEEYDVVVVGSGAAGMTAALTAAHHGLSAVVIEREKVYGGSTARSGGGLWLPGPEASTYLKHVAGDEVAPVRRDALLAYGPEVLAFVEKHTPLEFVRVPGYPDYHPEAPGGLAEGRTVEPRPLDVRRIGADLETLAPPYRAAPNGMAVTAVDYRWLSLGMRHPRSALTAVRLAASRFRGHRLTMGQALAAGLRAGLRRAGVPVLMDTPMTGLDVDEGRVAAVRSGARRWRARRGVILASGGFERNERMRREHQDLGTEWTVGAPGNVGDGIVMGRELGAALDLMDEAWWGPSLPLTGGPYFCLAERNLPGSLMVDGSGRRFVNESAPYVDVVHVMLGRRTGTPHLPSWLITDRTYRDRYLFAGRAPRTPLPRRWFDAGVAHRADTVEGLAASIGVPPEELRRTVERFNGFAASGRDDDFGRGDSAYDRYYGDPRQRPNPCLGPLLKPPFHAFALVPGDLGTKGGLRTDERARVLRPDGTPVPGLYAAGNTSASVMGRGYAGAGATLGPAMTFGYLAALDLTG
ncbi:3-oxosteroid 1-dehydrogenase [Actinoplanes campanulatus]|uniref:3-oxosteroid 1-dehydrogenase n=1 Tax=Actinoplanes campanulatus TaxID=113559 RepID=A0A7W5AI36_9ACTN|nr:FAD-dependent oxidoreductase [Actinoplanes campanulatus]MBB3096485.1 3-oxosteroid 1-dehydrogenase [Actinoplanes campanulatus]GGN17976.1 3-ketosteroid-delta-1-dehydrogenase [Actinoplanes campanulatus]GID38552.1 3-ketosteroid-delta-1-dehydrogenase [Actinoplanes campanulatus]